MLPASISLLPLITRPHRATLERESQTLRVRCVLLSALLAFLLSSCEYPCSWLFVFSQFSGGGQRSHNTTACFIPLCYTLIPRGLRHGYSSPKQGQQRSPAMAMAVSLLFIYATPPPPYPPASLQSPHPPSTGTTVSSWLPVSVMLVRSLSTIEPRYKHNDAIDWNIIAYTVKAMSLSQQCAMLGTYQERHGSTYDNVSYKFLLNNDAIACCYQNLSISPVRNLPVTCFTGHSLEHFCLFHHLCRSSQSGLGVACLFLIATTTPLTACQSSLGFLVQLEGERGERGKRGEGGWMTAVLLLCSPAISLGSPSWVRFCVCDRFFFNPTTEVVTFRLRGRCVLGVFLLPAFTRLGYERQDLLSPCDEMHVCTD